MENICKINLDNKGLPHWLYPHSNGIVCVVKGEVRSLAEREKTNAGDKNMRAIKIDPVAKTITEIELAQNPNETLQENLASFEMMTEWVDASDVPPPGAFITSF